MVNDPFSIIKTIAYKQATGKDSEGVSYKLFLKYAKTYLALETSTLLKDPIWDTYTEEELLVEYFIHMFTKDAEKLKHFEESMGYKKSEYDDFLEFANSAISKNEDVLESLSEEQDGFSFSPDVLGD